VHGEVGVDVVDAAARLDGDVLSPQVLGEPFEDARVSPGT
jgi:hypothetical protein